MSFKEHKPKINLETASHLLENAVSNSNHPFHQFVLATQHNNNCEVRTVVLRKWNLKRQTIIFHTDYRSPKVDQIKTSSNCSILFYSKPDKIQLRFKCKAHIHFKDKICNERYNDLTESQKKCYKLNQSPSTEVDLNKEILNVDPKENFSICVCNFYELDFLHLNAKKHKRIVYKWDKYYTMTSKEVVA